MVPWSDFEWFIGRCFLCLLDGFAAFFWMVGVLLTW